MWSTESRRARESANTSQMQVSIGEASKHAETPLRSVACARSARGACEHQGLAQVMYSSSKEWCAS